MKSLGMVLTLINPTLHAHTHTHTHTHTQDTSGVEVSEGHSSAAYCVFVDASGEVMFGVGDMSINDTIDAELVTDHRYTNTHIIQTQM